MRHGEIPSATVRVGLVDDSFRLEITNPGRASVEPVSGHGIRGMRRRVDAVGGTFHAGPTMEGFQVKATIPLGDE